MKYFMFEVSLKPAWLHENFWREGGREEGRWELVTINQRKEPRPKVVWHREVKILTPGK